ncbi:MAG TPA: MFS transporter [Candidatus Limnocylindrales bacterium]|nr:MFS transporter [Candidatus Limnocylindrales bacterium]
MADGLPENAAGPKTAGRDAGGFGARAIGTRILGPYAPLTGNARLTRFLASEFVSSIGDWLYLVALLIVVAKVADPTVLGIVGGVRVLPYVLLSGLGGVIADRFDRRLILIATDVARGGLMLVLAAAILLDASIWLIVAITVLAACGSALAGPTLAAYLPSLTRNESELGPANAAWATLDNIAFIIGPALAGILTATGGAAFAMLLNAATFGVIAVALATLPAMAASSAGGAEVPSPAAPDAPSSVARRDPSLVRRIAAPLLIDVGTSIVGGALGIATVVVAIDQLHGGEQATGLLNAATGIGGVLGGVLAGRLVEAPPARAFGAAGIACVVGLLGLGVSGALLVAIALMAVASAGLLIIDVLNATLLQRLIDDDARGRSSGILHSVGALSFAAGGFAFPVLAGATGVAPALGVIVVAGAIGVGLGLVSLRRSGPMDPRTRAAFRALQASPLGALAVARLARAAARSTPVHVEPGDIVIRQGDAADAAYVVEEGTFEVTIDGERRRTLSTGALFGELGLLLEAPRSATVTAATNGLLYRLDREAFLSLVRPEERVADQLIALYGRPA